MKGIRYDYQARDLYHFLHGSNWVHLRDYSGKGVGAVKSYRDYLAMKGLQPIVIERTIKRDGDKVLIGNYRPAQTYGEVKRQSC